MPRDMLDLPLIGREAIVRADTINEADRTIDIIWTTGATVQRARWEGWDTVEFDEELEVTPEALRLERLNDGAPFLDSHRSWGGVANVLGSVVPGSVRVENGQGTATIRLTNAEDAIPAVQRILERTINKVSVGYRVHRYEITKRDGARELWRAVDWEPYEISAVAMPADPGASIRSEQPGRESRNPCVIIRRDTPAATAALAEEAAMPNDNPHAAGGESTAVRTDAAAAASQAPAQQPDAATVERQRASEIVTLCARHGMDGAFQADMIARGVSVDQVRAAILERLSADNPAGRVVEASPRGRLDETETRRRAMEDALFAGLTRGAQPSDLARDYIGMSIPELAAERLGERRVPGSFGAREELVRRAFHSTSDFPILFENAMNRSLAARYREAQPTYRRIARQRTYMDFRDHTTVRLGDFPTLKEVSPQAGELQSGTFAEAKEKTAVKAYGVRVDLSRQMLVNDSLDGIMQILNDRGAAVARFEDATFYAMMISGTNSNGPTMVETTRQMFNTTDGTLAASAATIDITSLSLGRAALRKRKGVGGADLELTARILLVGPDRETVAQQVVAPIQAQQAGNVNPFSGLLEVVTTAKITGNSWYLFASPDEAACFEWGLLEGYDAPRFRIEEVFGRQGTSLSLEHDFGCGAIDFRGGYRNAGA